jgi:hypothetical protein
MSWTSLVLRAFICLKSIILSTPRSFDQKIAVFENYFKENENEKNFTFKTL